MTPQEKAHQLIMKFAPLVITGSNPEDDFNDAKQCALIAVDEILTNNRELTNYPEYLKMYEKVDNYWKQVRKEIEQL